MLRKDVQDELEKVFREVFDDIEVCIFDEMTAEDIETWDSLMHIALLLAIEKRFNISFKTEEVILIQKVGHFIDCLMGKTLC